MRLNCLNTLNYIPKYKYEYVNIILLASLYYFILLTIHYNKQRQNWLYISKEKKNWYSYLITDMFTLMFTYKYIYEENV